MATVKKGTFYTAHRMWRHLRWTKRAYWKGERRAGNAFARKEARDAS